MQQVLTVCANYVVGRSAPLVYEEAWKQLRLARYRIPVPEIMNCSVAPTEGHNDFLMSIALVTEALASFSAPKDAGYVRPRALYEEESRY